MANILFKKGSYNDFKTKILADKKSIVDGALYLTEDEGGLYLGKNTTTGTTEGTLTRIQGSVIIYESVNAFTNSVQPPYSSDVIYFITANNALIRWDPSFNNGDGQPLGGWIQLNPSQNGIIADIGTLQATVKNHGDQLAKALFKEGDGTEGKPKKVDVGGHKLTNVIDPIADQDAATKKYVDTAESNLLGTTNDDADEETIRGVKNYADTILGDDSDTSSEYTVYGVKKYAEGVSSIAEAAKEKADIALLKEGDGTEGKPKKVDVDGHKLTNVTDPTAAQDAATKNYVDTAKSDLLGGDTSTDTTSNTIKGVKRYAQSILGPDNDSESNITVNGNRTYIIAVDAVADAANTRASNALLKDGSEAMTGALNMGSHKITAVTDPTNDQDAATKKYVDTAKSDLLGGDTNTDTTSNTIKGVKRYAQSILGNTNSQSTEMSVYGVKKYAEAVSAVANDALSKTSDGTVAGNITFNGQVTHNNTLLVKGTNVVLLPKTENGTTTNARIIGLVTPIDNSEATSKSYVDTTIANAIKTNDAMTFKGTLGTNGTISSLPTTATVYSSASSNPLHNQKPQRGDTFKVVTASTYAGNIDAKVGDIIINAGEDDGVPSWTHITAGYEANYNQQLVGDETNKKVYLTDGLGTAATNSVGSLTIVSNNDNIGISFEATGTDTTVTLSMTWGSF